MCADAEWTKDIWFMTQSIIVLKRVCKNDTVGMSMQKCMKLMMRTGLNGNVTMKKYTVQKDGKNRGESRYTKRLTE